jgi:hypothetical protein
LNIIIRETSCKVPHCSPVFFSVNHFIDFLFQLTVDMPGMLRSIRWALTWRMKRNQRLMKMQRCARIPLTAKTGNPFLPTTISNGTHIRGGRPIALVVSSFSSSSSDEDKLPDTAPPPAAKQQLVLFAVTSSASTIPLTRRKREGGFPTCRRGTSRKIQLKKLKLGFLESLTRPTLRRLRKNSGPS